MMNQKIILHDWLKNHVLTFGFILIFIVSGIYTHPNLGEPHLALPANLLSWLMASWVIVFGLFQLVYTKKFCYPQRYLYFIVFPLVILFLGAISNVSVPITWLFRLLYILGGLFFLFALFQFSLNQKSIDNILFVLILAVGLQAVIGILNVFDVTVGGWLYSNADGTPRGIFQQVNVLASFLASGLCICIYYISRPSFMLHPFFIKGIVAIIFVLSIYLLAYAGSRVGVLSVLLSVPLILWARFKQLKKHKKLLLTITLMSVLAVYLGQSGLNTTVSKSIGVVDEINTDARITIYSIGFELVKEKPISGHGIGEFLKVWNLQASDYIGRNPEVALGPLITHPHNEILLWMIEGGLLSLIGIIFVILGIIIGLYQCGFQRGGAYAAMLLPISLHAQVEHPFYSSALHWFLWLFFIFLVLRHQAKNKSLRFSDISCGLIYVSSAFIGIAVTIFAISTMRAETNLFNFVYGRGGGNPAYMQPALSNIYTFPIAEKVAMGVTLYSSIESNNRAQALLFEEWAHAHVEKYPEIDVYRDLIRASIFLRPEGKGCDALRAALKMYAQVPQFQEGFKSNCME